MKNLCVILLLSVVTLPVLALTNDNVEKYTTWLGIKTYITSNGLHYTIKDKNSTSINKQFNAKYPIAIGVQVTVANISLGYTFAGTQQWFNDPTTLKNASKYWGLDLNYMGDKLIFENQLNSFGKFEVSNNCKCSDDLVKAATSINNNYVDPLLKSFEVSSNLQYIFNGNNWSYKAMLNTGARQTKSAGSIIAMVSYNYHQIRSTTDYVIHQTNNNSNFDKYNLTQKIQAASPALSLGYGYTLVFKKFYVGGAAYAGSGWVFNRVKLLNTSNTGDDFSFNGRLKANAGYNGKRFYFGVASNFVSITNNIKTELKSNWLNYEYNFYIGLRLATRKLL